MTGEQAMVVGAQVGALLNEYRTFTRTLVAMMKAQKRHSNDMKVGHAVPHL